MWAFPICHVCFNVNYGMGAKLLKKSIIKFLREYGYFGAFLNAYPKFTSFDEKVKYKADRHEEDDFFMDSFSFTIWDDTPQGWRFWRKVHELWCKYCKGIIW